MSVPRSIMRVSATIMLSDSSTWKAKLKICQIMFRENSNLAASKPKLTSHSRLKGVKSFGGRRSFKTIYFMSCWLRAAPA